MFNDEDVLAFRKMRDFSPVDGFLDITENLANMISFAANQPSVGLFYIQQHTRNATPNVLNLRTKVSDESRELALHAQDLEDSMDMLGSMKECGPVIADEMIEDIKRCLSIMQGSMRGSSWSPATWRKNSLFTQTGDDRRRSNYLSTIFKVQASLGWERPRVLYEDGESSQMEGSVGIDRSSNFLMVQEEAVAEDFPLWSELRQESSPDKSLADRRLLWVYDENYEKFKADREARLEEWLGRSEEAVKSAP